MKTNLDGCFKIVSFFKHFMGNVIGFMRGMVGIAGESGSKNVQSARISTQIVAIDCEWQIQSPVP